MNKDVEDLNLPPQTTKSVTFYSRNGTPCEEKQALAKSVISTYDYGDVSKHFYIRYGRGELLDPFGVDSGTSVAKLSTMYKFKKVSEKAFSNYLKYLETKNRIHFTSARRLIME
jgi:hypothetical protein